MPVVATVPLPTFVDGTVPVAADLNAVSSDLSVLGTVTMGFGIADGVVARPALKVELVTAQPLASGAVTAVVFGASPSNTDTMWFPPAGAKIVVQTAGWYRIQAQVAYDTAAAGLRIARLFVNGTADANAVASGEVEMGSPSPDNLRCQVEAFEHLATGAAVYLGAYQNTGAPINLQPATTWGSWLSLTWEAPY